MGRIRARILPELHKSLSLSPHTHTHTCVIPEGFEAEYFPLKYQHPRSDTEVCVRFPDEKVKGKVVFFTQLKDFNDCLQQCLLTDIRSTGGKRTWNNKVMGRKRITGRLDRMVQNDAGIDQLPGSYHEYISTSTSDDSPMFVHLITTQNIGPKPFTYFNY